MAPGAPTQGDTTIYVGLLAASFDASALPTASHTLALDAARTSGVITFDRFACYAWRTYGMSPDGSNVYLYALSYPQFMTLPDGSERIAFSATKYHLATLANGIVDYGGGNAEPAAQLMARVCAVSP